MRMRAAFVLLIAALGGSTRASPEMETLAVRRRAEKLQAEGTRADRGQLVSSVREVLEQLPRQEGNRTAPRLMTVALALDSSDTEGAFSLAMDLRRRLIEDRDARAGVPYLRALAALYPHDADLHGREAATLLAAVGRIEEAREEYAGALAAAPDDDRAAAVLLDLAELHEKTDAIDAALESYRLAARLGGEGVPHLCRAQILWRHRGDFEAAREALAAALAAVRHAAPESRREIVERVAAEQRAMLDQEIRRKEALRRVRRIDRAVLLVMLGWILALTVVGLLLWSPRSLPRGE